MSEKVLYWVDDETMYLNIIKILCSKNVRLEVYAGSGRLQDFMREFPKKYAQHQQNNDTVYCLLDVQMPVPKQLMQESLWQEYGAMSRNQVCGIALAHYLHRNHGLDIDHIRLLSGIPLLIVSSGDLLKFAKVSSLPLSEKALWSKSKLTLEALNDWLNPQ